MSYRFWIFSCLLILRASADNSDSVGQPLSKTAKFNLMVTTLKEIISSNSKVYAFQDIPPSNHTTITCSVHIINITSVNIKTQTFSLDLMLNSAWHDPRLIHPNITEEFAIPSKYNKKVWLPDVGFSNSIAGAVTRITDESLFSVMIGPGGAIRMTSRLNVELACDMQFEYYPMDTQICEVQLQSWKYPIKELTLNWASKRAMTYSQEADRALPQYNVYINTTKSWLRKLNIRQDYKCVETYDTSGRGSYSCLEISFIFRRNIEFYAYDIYIPLLLIVLISFIGLFIDFNVMPARIGVGSLSISATTNIGRALRVNTPPVSYTKAADVWLWTCLIFVYAAFMELGVVNVFNRKFRFDKATAGTSFFKRSPPAKVVDKVARIFFPSAFVLFNIIYWSYYLTVSQYNWDHMALIRKIFKENEVLYQNTTIEG